MYSDALTARPTSTEELPLPADQAFPHTRPFWCRTSSEYLYHAEGAYPFVLIHYDNTARLGSHVMPVLHSCSPLPQPQGEALSVRSAHRETMRAPLPPRSLCVLRRRTKRIPRRHRLRSLNGTICGTRPAFFLRRHSDKRAAHASRDVNDRGAVLPRQPGTFKIGLRYNGKCDRGAAEKVQIL